MASKTYKSRVLVLRKTKLRDKDLIVSMMDEEGKLLKGVAKGARRPGGAFAARLELFTEADVLMAQGRSLDVVCEARLADPRLKLSWGLDQSACAAPLAELLFHIAQPDLPQPRVYDISRAAFQLMGAEGVSQERRLGLCAASLWKVMSQIGFRPSLSQCVLCGNTCRPDEAAPRVPFSVADGGLVCGECRRPADAIMVDANTVRWCEALIMMRFDEVVAAGPGVPASLDVLQLARMWSRAHIGHDLKSLNFLFTSGLLGV